MLKSLSDISRNFTKLNKNFAKFRIFRNFYNVFRDPLDSCGIITGRVMTPDSIRSPRRAEKQSVLQCDVGAKNMDCILRREKLLFLQKKWRNVGDGLTRYRETRWPCPTVLLEIKSRSSCHLGQVPRSAL